MQDSSRSLSTVRWALRLLAVAALLQSAGALVAILTQADDFRPLLLNAWVIVTFGGSGALLWRTQPQFSAVFSVFAAGWAEPVLAYFAQPHLPIIAVTPALFWLLLLQEPFARPAASQALERIGLGVAVVLGIVYASFADPHIALRICFYAHAGLAILLLTKRCFAIGAHRSPRTLLFAFFVTPLIIAILVEYVLGLTSIAEVPRYIVGFLFTLAPVGSLLYEIAQRRPATATPGKATKEVHP